MVVKVTIDEDTEYVKVINKNASDKEILFAYLDYIHYLGYHDQIEVDEINGDTYIEVDECITHYYNIERIEDNLAQLDI